MDVTVGLEHKDIFNRFWFVIREKDFFFCFPLFHFQSGIITKIFP